MNQRRSTPLLKRPAPPSRPDAFGTSPGQGPDRKVRAFAIVTTARADLLVVLAACIWGLAFVFQKMAMDHIGPFTFVASRTAIAALVLLPFALREGPPMRPVLPVAAIGGMLFLSASALQQTGMVTATVTNTSFLTTLYVVAIPFLTWALNRRAPPRSIWIAAALAALGALVLTGGVAARLSPGDGLIVVGAVFWAGFALAAERGARSGRPLGYTCMAFAVCAAVAGTVALATEAPRWGDLVSAAPLILYVGILSSALTFGLTAMAMQVIPAARAMILLSLEMPLAALAGAVLLGERLPLAAWAGAGLILAAVLVVQARPARA